MPPSSDRRTRFDRTMQILLAVICAAFAARGWHRAMQPAGSDFTIYYRSGEAALAGDDPTVVPGAIYLPAFAVALIPLSLLPYALAAALWQSASLAALLWSARCSARLAAPRGEPPSARAEWLTLLCVLRLADSNLGNGQVNAFTLAMLLAGLSALRERRDIAAGAWVGAAAAAKILPGIAIAYVALRGQWRAAVSGALFAIALALIPPALFLGVQPSGRALVRWWDVVVRPYQAGGDELFQAREYAPGQSLSAAGYRLLAKTPATSRGAEGPTANAFDFEPVTAYRIVLAIAAAHVVAWAWTVLRRRADLNSHSFASEAALTLALALVLGPLVHKAHMLWLMPAYAVAWSGRVVLPRGPRIARRVLIGLSIALIAFTAPAIVGRAAATGLLSHNAIFLGLEAMVAALFLDRWFQRAPVEPHASAGLA